MLLRRITKHVTDQNWFAVFIDFLIVVIGVFIGIQVANWNDEQSFHDKETQLLKELKVEVEAAVAYANYIQDSYTQVSDAGRRSLEFIELNEPCSTECWNILVDFIHASQWQDARVIRQIYDEMRRQSLPSSKKITTYLDRFLIDNESTALNFDDKPYYREIIRQIIPINVQDFYWKNCYTYENNKETYVHNCNKGIVDELALEIVNTIIQNPEVKPHLTRWVSTTTFSPSDNDNLNKHAQEALQAIEQELERR